jgi:hypothetical protein
MRNLFHVFCAVAFSLAAMQSVRAASERTEQPIATSQAPASGESQAVSCISAAYQHYLQLGAQPQNAWNDAVRDCQNGVDPSCIQFAQQHYLQQGMNAANAWSTAVRDCRTITPRYLESIVPRRY